MTKTNIQNGPSAYRIIISVILVLTLCGCGETPRYMPKHHIFTDDNTDTTTPQIATAPEEPTDSIDNKWNDMAQLLSGQPIDTTNQYYSLSGTKGWIQFQHKSDVLWNQHKRNTDKAKAWQEKNISVLTRQCAQLLYPFSGADWPYANTFFPDVKEYFLLALEPVGSVPFGRGADTDRTAADTFGTALYNSVHDILGFSFFITKNMRTDLSKHKADGTTPLMLMFLARTGKKVHSVTIGRLRADGSIDTQSHQKPNIARYELGDNNNRQVVNYISCDLSNYKFGKDSILNTYLQKAIRPGCASYFKAASYLMHSPNFTLIKRLVLNKSNFILEDDSGIPYRDLIGNGFTCLLYGNYTRPIDMFKTRYQKDLQNAYQEQKSTPLNFRIGYGVKYNLITAVKE